jgi:hypothetical protein
MGYRPDRSGWASETLVIGISCRTRRAQPGPSKSCWPPKPRATSQGRQTGVRSTFLRRADRLIVPKPRTGRPDLGDLIARGNPGGRPARPRWCLRARRRYIFGGRQEPARVTSGPSAPHLVVVARSRYGSILRPEVSERNVDPPRPRCFASSALSCRANRCSREVEVRLRPLLVAGHALGAGEKLRPSVRRRCSP